MTNNPYENTRIDRRQRHFQDLLDFKIFWVASAIKSPMREVVVGWDLPGSSGVRWPRFRTFSMAVSMALAAISMRNEYRSIRAAEAMAAMGLARLRPAISGADPCTGSYKACCSPRLADGKRPMDPVSMAASSLKMSPNMLVVRTTSKLVGRSISRMAQLSTYM